MIIRHKIFTLFSWIVLLLTLGSCRPYAEEIINDDEHTYVSFSTRAQGNAASINADTRDNEDAVLRVRLIICKAATGEVVHNALHAVADLTDYHKEIEVKKGEYDCYIVANETASMTAALETVTFRDALWQLAPLTQIPMPDINQAISPTMGMPMTTHVRANVTAAHTHGNALRLDAMLIRALSKVTLNIQRALKNGVPTENAANLVVKAITVKQLPSTFSLFPPKSPFTGTLAAPQSLQHKVSPVGNESLTRYFYVPECLCPNTAGVITPTVEFTYGKHGIERKAELTIDQLNFSSTLPHFTLLTNATLLSRNSIVRNTHYTADVQLEGWDEEVLKYKWKILPWNKYASVKQFKASEIDLPSGPELQPGVSQSGIDAKILSVDANVTNRMTLRFKIRKPNGAMWRFNLTNHLDFRFTQLENSYGIASEDEITLTIETTKPWAGYVRSTELYLTIDGKEVQIVKHLVDQGEKRVGPSFRYLIRQTS